MIFYISILCIFLIFSLLSYDQNKHRRVIFILLCLFLTFIAAMRYNVGFDYPSYHFNISQMIKMGKMSSWQFYERIEPGCKLIINLTILSGIPQLFFILSSSLTMLFVGITIHKISNDPILSLLIFLCFPFFYLATFTIIRQWLAIAIAMYAYTHLIRNKKGYFVFWTIFASFFHLSALISLILLAIDKINLSKVQLFALIFIMGFSTSILYSLIEYFLPLSALKMQRFAEARGGEKLIYIALLFSLTFIILKNKLEEIDSNNMLHIKAITFGSGLILMLSSFGHVAQRIGVYFIFPLILLIPDLIHLFKGEQKTFIKMAIYTGFSLIFLYSLQLSKDSFDSPNIPFTFFFFK